MHHLTRYWPLIVVLQVGILIGMFAKGYYPVWVGEEVQLKVVPVDPRDIFRGNYAQLRYDFTSISREELPNDLPPGEFLPYGTPVYLQLRKAGKYHQASFLSLSEPAEGPFLQGIIEYDSGSGYIGLHFGIESFFAPKEKALQLEDLINRRAATLPVPSEEDTASGAQNEEIEVEVYVRVKVAPNGAARLRSIHCDAAGF